MAVLKLQLWPRSSIQSLQSLVLEMKPNTLAACRAVGDLAMPNLQPHILMPDTDPDPVLRPMQDNCVFCSIPVSLQSWQLLQLLLPYPLDSLEDIHSYFQGFRYHHLTSPPESAALSSVL